MIDFTFRRGRSVRTGFIAVIGIVLLGVGLACEKDVHEVRRSTPRPVAPGMTAETSSAAAPAAPRGEPVTIGGAARTSNDH
jgi:hypothetical protein